MFKSKFNKVFGGLFVANRLFNSDDGAAGGGGGGDTDPAPAGGADSGASGEPPAAYYGSQDLNPEQRPLKIITEGMSNAEIDALISAGDPSDVFVTDKDLADKPAPKKPDAPAAPAVGANTESGDPGKQASDDDEKKFLESVSMSAEEFRSLPEKAQERLVELASAKSDQAAVSTEKAELARLQADMDALLKDPVHLARIEEHRSGKKFVATDLAPVKLSDISAEVLDKIDAALAEGKKEDASQILASVVNELVQSRAKDAVAIERSVLDQRVALEQAQKDAYSTLLSLNKIDKRFNFKEEDFAKTSLGEKSEEGKFVKWLQENHFNLKQINSLGADKLYAAYSKHTGWDTQRIESAVNKEKASLLDRLRNPKPAAKPFVPGKRAVSPKPGSNSAGWDRQSLKEQLIKGDTSGYDVLLDQAENKPEMLEQLEMVFVEAKRERMVQSRE